VAFSAISCPQRLTLIINIVSKGSQIKGVSKVNKDKVNSPFSKNIAIF
jgi:hypothetical protein